MGNVGFSRLASLVPFDLSAQRKLLTLAVARLFGCAPWA
jgi:hypothetical protein